MKKLSIKILCTFCVLITLVSTSVFSTFAISYSNNVEVKEEGIIIVNMDTNQTVFEKNADKKLYPASTTKIMSYIIVAENVDDFDNTKVTIKQSVLDALEGTGSSLANVGEHVGKTMSIKDLLYSMMVPSGNDAAMVLADYIGDGDISKFVDMMNQKAKELGCENTNFKNPDGLHDDEHYTTARDLYKISTYALKLPMFEEITNTTEYYVTGDEYPITTTNYLIDEWRGGDYYYRYAKGIKTGTTDEAGRCLVTTASADGYSYMAVLLHAPYKEDVDEEYYTFTDAANLFRWALTELELKNIASTKTPICEQNVKFAWKKNSVLLVPQIDFNAIVPTDYKESWIKVEYKIDDYVEAPIKEGDVLGTATIYYQDEKMSEKQELTTVNLVSSESVDRSGILYVLNITKTILASYWFLFAILLIIIIMIIYYFASKISKKNRKKRRKVKNYRNL